ncbi:MAG: hypothetical protein QOE41_3256 [Mycobacterium sp.]|jgi:hypothetical protein|nr:hypothetical protein [Mycobacterium sp.]MDT5133945.1 hypothetical protein [Mycobacterium sp.]
MYVKRVAGAAAIAASVGMSALAVSGLANAAPLQPPPCNNCQPAPGGPGNGPQDHPPQGNAPQGPQDHLPQGPQSYGPQGNPPQGPQDNGAHGPQGNPPQGPHGNGPQGPQGNPPPGPQGNPPAGPNNQPRPQPYAPQGAFSRGDAHAGGPTDAPRGFSTADHGAPPPPPARGFGWNDGPPPGGPPPDWDGPPPPGGWNGPPPPGGWNGRWNGPPRDVERARTDFGPFNYDGYTANPVFNPVFGGWGFWYFGVWIPLY